MTATRTPRVLWTIHFLAAVCLIGSTLPAGYTSVQDVIVGSVNDVQVYKKFSDDGRLKVRVSLMVLLNTEQQAEYVAETYEPNDDPNNRLTFLGWKLAVDGGVAARTILMYDKSLYAAEAAYPYHSQETLNHMVQILHDTGLQVAVHVSGDEGVDMTLTAFEQAMKANPRPDPRHRIEHGLFPSPEALQRMKDLKIILATQPQWTVWHGDGFALGTNETTMSHYLPLRTMLEMGIPLAFGCDVPASIYQEPKWAFAGATLRRTSSNVVLTPDERLIMPEVLRIHTMGSAYAGCAETTTGSLEPGKLADLVVWSHDLYSLSPADVNDVQAEMTIVNGEIVYDAQTL
jgi:predicted amidohydrolase YtcJ